MDILVQVRFMAETVVAIDTAFFPECLCVQMGCHPFIYKGNDSLCLGFFVTLWSMVLTAHKGKSQDRSFEEFQDNINHSLEM